MAKLELGKKAKVVVWSLLGGLNIASAVYAAKDKEHDPFTNGIVFLSSVQGACTCAGKVVEAVKEEPAVQAPTEASAEA